MVGNGYAKKHNASDITGGDDLFILTKVGALLCLERDEKLDPDDFPEVLKSAEVKDASTQ